MQEQIVMDKKEYDYFMYLVEKGKNKEVKEGEKIYVNIMKMENTIRNKLEKEYKAKLWDNRLSTICKYGIAYFGVLVFVELIKYLI